TPVFEAGVNVASHGAGRFPWLLRQQGLDDGEVFAGLFGKPMVIIAGLIALPGHVAESAKEDFQATDFFGQEDVGARIGDEVVKPTVNPSGLVDKTRRTAAQRHQSSQLGSQTVEFSKAYPAARRARGLALQNAAHLTDFAHLTAADPAHDGATIGHEIND